MEDVESHPIPQDVTGFQFKIIGDITVKQFTYLAGPSFVIWFFFQTSTSLFIKLPLSVLLGGLGVSLAFLPIAGRPMDTMIANFIKALFNPTRFLYQKEGGNYTYAPIVQKEKVQKSQKYNILSTSQPSAIPSAIPQASTPNQKKTTQAAYAPTSSPQEVLEKPFQKRLENIHEDKNEALKRKEQKHTPTPSPTKDTLEFEKQLQLLLTQKEQLTQQLIALQQKLDLQKKNVFAPTTAKSDMVMAKPQTPLLNLPSPGSACLPELSKISIGIVFIAQMPATYL